MSYDVHIYLPVKGLEEKYWDACHLSNITWNVRKLIFESSGWDIKNEASNGAIFQWLEKIKRGASELSNHPEKYKHMEAANGWGTVEGTLRFYKDCIREAEQWITWHEEFLPAAVIWVC